MGNGIMEHTINLIVLFILHYLADFRFQSREMGKRKSEDFSVLVQHAVIIFSVFFLFGTLTFNTSLILFSSIYAIIHGLQDWFMWRGYKLLVKRKIARENFDGDMNNTWMGEELKIFKYWEDPKFYDTIGLDQTLHFITIVLVYNWVL